MYLVISLLVLRAGYGISLYQFLIIAYLFTLKRRITLSYKYRASEASEGKIHAVFFVCLFFFSPKNINIKVNR